MIPSHPQSCSHIVVLYTHISKTVLVASIRSRLHPHGLVCLRTVLPASNLSRQVAKSVTSPLLDSEMGVVFVGY